MSSFGAHASLLVMAGMMREALVHTDHIPIDTTSHEMPAFVPACRCINCQGRELRIQNGQEASTPMVYYNPHDVKASVEMSITNTPTTTTAFNESSPGFKWV